MKPNYDKSIAQSSSSYFVKSMYSVVRPSDDELAAVHVDELLVAVMSSLFAVKSTKSTMFEVESGTFLRAFSLRLFIGGETSNSVSICL